ncbi:MAG: hypothetical protein ABDH32_01000 [Candidatus Caldarchaeales archaeon]
MKEVELLSLLAEFKPYEFSEENYIRSPLIVLVERSNDQDAVLVAMNNRGIEALERLSSKNFFKKATREIYFVDKLSTLDALNKFSWIVRSGWKDECVYYLWSLLNSYMKSTDYDSLSSTMMNDFNLQVETCFRRLGFDSVPEYSMMLNLLQKKLEEYLSKAPPTLYQKIIDYLCIYGESTVDELFRRVLKGGISVSTLYKALSRLKKDNYVKVAKHVRITNRGPMRELLASNCGNCLYNHSSHINCYRATLNQLSAILRALYGKTLTYKDLERLYIEFRSIPYPQRVVRRVNEMLVSLYDIRTRLDDKLTSSIISKIQAITGINIL